MKITNFDAEFGELLGGTGGGTGGSSSVIASQIVTNYIALIGAGDVTYYLPSLVASLTGAGAAHMHIVGEVQIADGTSATFYLANWPDAESVAAYVNGVRENPTVSGDAVTFAGVPPVLARLQFDYIAELT